jgi:hypothetical protein
MAKKTLAAHDFIALWRSGACDDAAHEQLATILRRCPLSGRLDHGYSSDTGFGEFLSDRWKRLSWVFGPAALGGFMGKSARDICVGLGFGEVLCVWTGDSESRSDSHWGVCVRVCVTRIERARS